MKFRSGNQRKAVMARLKEYRVYDISHPNGQGHYILAENKTQAISKDIKARPRDTSIRDAWLWKTKKNGIYRLTPTAKKKMGL